MTVVNGWKPLKIVADLCLTEVVAERCSLKIVIPKC